jgi:hypothetical protein
MAESREPPFSKEKRGFFISISVVDREAFQKRGGLSSPIPPFLAGRLSHDLG